MAFDKTGWVSFAGGAGSGMLFDFRTNDLLSEVDDSGYFNPVASELHKGDKILVSSDLDGTPLPGVLMVTSEDFAATVTTAAPA